MKITRTARWTTAVLAATALTLSGCGGGSSDDSPSAPSSPSSIGKVAVDEAAAAALPKEFAKGVDVASDIPTPPMVMLDAKGKTTGFDYDLAQALGGKLGVPFRVKKQAWDSIVPSLQSGKHDIIMSGMNDTKERQQTLDFVDYFHAGFSILVKKGNPEKITTVLDLCGTDVAVQKATVQGEILRTYDDECTAAGSSPITLVELPSETDAQTAVRSGKAVADVVDSAVAEYSAATAGEGSIFEVVKDPDNPAGYEPVYTGVGVLKKNAELTKALDLALASLIEDGTYQKLLDKYSLGAYAVTESGINRAES